MPKHISVIIPTFNRKTILKKCLKALSSQTCSKADFEVLLIDDGSTDGTSDMVRDISREFNYGLRYFFQSNKGPAAARNIGIRNAEGDIILFIGDDTMASPSLLEEHIHWHDKYPYDNVGILGHLTWSDDAHPTPFMIWLENGGIQSKYTQIRDPSNIDSAVFFYSSNISLKRRFLLSKNGFFDESFPYAAFEDIELGYRLKKEGLSIKYDPAAIGYHYHYTSFKDACRRMVKIGLSGQILAKKKGTRSFNSFLVFAIIIFGFPVFAIFYPIAEYCEKKYRCRGVYWYLMHYCYAIGVIRYRTGFK